MKRDRSVADLPAIVASLPAADRDVFDRLFQVTVATGRARVPPSMAALVEQRFGSVERVETQTTVRIVNRATVEGSLISPARSARPVEAAPLSLEDAARETAAGDSFSAPLEMTTEDTFGRVQGQASVSASNVAKSDAAHGLVIFRNRDPLVFTRRDVADYLDVAWRWFRAVHAGDAEAAYPFVVWNCLWRAGASILHGHMQTFLARGLPYARVERLRAAAQSYRGRHGRDYFDDLFRAHEAVGCGVRHGAVRCMASLTPTKDREVVLLAPAPGTALAGALHAVLSGLRDTGTRSFNVGIAAPPLAADGRDWTGFPLVAWVVDRGDLRSAVSDIGALELFAEPVVTTDPVATARDLARWISADSPRS